MGKMILISGENGSGKSRFAEKLIENLPGERCYIATMIPQTEDNRRRIENHRKQREGLHFTTLEIGYQVKTAPVTPNSAVLLEDVSNLLANTVFEHKGSGEAVFRDICALAQRCGTLVAVTISGMDPEEYSGETADYIRTLNRLNEKLLSQADAAAQMQDHTAHWQKGDFYAAVGISGSGPVHL